VALISGLGLSLFGAGATWEFVLGAVSRVVFSLLLAIIGSLVMLRFLTRLPFGRRLILETELLAGAEGSSAPERDMRWLGKRGTALSPLRPAGIAMIEGERVDVVSDGDLIEPGAPIVVTHVDGNRIVVRQDRTLTERS
jgi:membrane-bound serine protease (ClpP class)